MNKNTINANEYLVSVYEQRCPTCGEIMTVERIFYDKNDGFDLIFKCENDDHNTTYLCIIQDKSMLYIKPNFKSHDIPAPKNNSWETMWF
jgi:hypothetical protein